MKPKEVSNHKQYSDDATEALLARLPLDGRGRVAWKKLAAELGVSEKSRGYLSLVASGKRPASNNLRRALGLHPITVAVPPCPSCGGVHVTKRCAANAHHKYAPHPVTRLSRLTNRERAKREFEAWAMDRNMDVTQEKRFPDHDDYVCLETERMWLCWLESRMAAAGVL